MRILRTDELHLSDVCRTRVEISAFADTRRSLLLAFGQPGPQGAYLDLDCTAAEARELAALLLAHADAAETAPAKAAA